MGDGPRHDHADTLSFLNEANRRYLLATRRHELTQFQAELATPGWQKLPDRPGVAVKALERDGVHYLLARSSDRCHKERAIRRRQRRPMMQKLRRLRDRVSKGRLKDRDKILEAVGRIKAAAPKAQKFIHIQVEPSGRVAWTYRVEAFRAALARDGAICCGATKAAGRPRSSGKPTCSWRPWNALSGF